MRNQKPFYVLTILLFLCSGCFKGEKVDVVIHNARVHTMDKDNTIQQAIAIRDGIIIEVGPERQILNKYQSNEQIDALGKDVFPGFTDAHANIVDYAKLKLSIDLSKVKSIEEVYYKIEKYTRKHKSTFILGTGLSKSLWMHNSDTIAARLTETFPNLPVLLCDKKKELALVNQKTIELLENTSINHSNSGYITKKEIKLLLENEFNFSNSQLKNAIIDIQNELIQYGITGIHEAGISFEEIQLFKELIKTEQFQLNIYAMLKPSEQNFSFAKKNGPFSYQNLTIQSFNVSAPQSTTSHHELENIVHLCLETNYQMNFNMNNDDNDSIFLNLLKAVYTKNQDHRWRVEKAGFISNSDLQFITACGAFPSIQPNESVQNFDVNLKQLGEKRIQSTFPYNTLKSSYGMVAIGSSFPNYNIDPFETIFAAVQRKSIYKNTTSELNKTEALSLQDCIKGMTIWPTYAAFEENRLGSLEKGKEATLVIFESPISSSNNFTHNFSYLTIINGKKVYPTE